MADNESSLQIRTKAELNELKAATQALDAYNAALRENIALTHQANQVGGGAAGASATPAGGGGGANAGAAPPAPAPPPTAATGGAPPAGPSSAAPATGGAAQGAPPAPPAPPAGATAPGAPAAPQAPGAAPGAAPTGPVGPGGSQWNAKANRWQLPSGLFVAGAPPPGAGAAGPAGAPPSAPSAFGSMSAAGGAAFRGGRSLVGAVGGGLAGGAAAAIGLGLGASLFALPLVAVQRYMQLSTVLAQLNQRFREATDGSELFGTAMGYGIARSAQLADTLGAVHNRFDRSSAVEMAGFARYTGADAGAALHSLGRVSELGGRPLTGQDLASAMTLARAQNMDQGRIEEFLQRIEQTSSAQFGATGATSMGSTLGAMALQSHVYAAGDPRRANDDLMGGVHSMLTGSGPMRSYMMRAMGFGSASGPGYIEMRKRQDAGVYDPRNLIDLFGTMQRSGWTQGQMFRGIEEASGGGLKAHQIEALVSALGTAEGLEGFKRTTAEGGGPGALMDFLGTLSDEQRGKFEAAGFSGLGKDAISAGESYENRIEAMMMKVGGEVAQMIPNLQDTIESMLRIMENLVGEDLGGRLERIAGSAEALVKWVERGTATGTGGVKGLGEQGIRYTPEVIQHAGGWRDVYSAYRGNRNAGLSVDHSLGAAFDAGLQYSGFEGVSDALFGRTNLARPKAGGGSR